MKPIPTREDTTMARLRRTTEHVWVEILPADLPPGVAQLEFEFVRGDGTPRCEGVMIRAIGSLNGALLRTLPLGALEEEARRVLADRPAPIVRAAPRRGRCGQSPQFLAEIMELYRHAEALHPRRPIAWMHEYGLPAHLRPQNVETVRTWVRQARTI